MNPLYIFFLQRPFRFPSWIVLVAALLGFLVGCRSNTIVLDQRPAWVTEAEQRLKQDPVFNVNGPQETDSRPLWGRQATNASSEPQARRTAGKRRLPQQASAATASQPVRPKPTAAQPAGVSWGETKITVQIKE